ncbi:hypothetical protein B6N60_00624 [Richelia sinica FACHB-800]|uniref:Uncharacterized protein n=1 Tax=Richelia sinica FACHB-800 TaxID=1357546 RepID=A0A975Y3A6_9NOST|nr:hypothetical protein B6N60_00624 [Richelia sinica FACHB-800]
MGANLSVTNSLQLLIHQGLASSFFGQFPFSCKISPFIY